MLTISGEKDQYRVLLQVGQRPRRPKEAEGHIEFEGADEQLGTMATSSGQGGQKRARSYRLEQSFRWGPSVSSVTRHSKSGLTLGISATAHGSRM